MVKKLNTQEFLNIEKEEGVIVVDFFANWCHPCNMLAPVFEEVSNEMEESIHFVKIDIDECSEIAQKYEIATIPTIAIIRNGELIGKKVGFMPKELLKNSITSEIYNTDL